MKLNTNIINLTLTICLSVLFAAAVYGANSRTDFELVSNGRPSAVIVLGVGSTQVERYAASELVKYVRLMSGVTLPVAQEGHQDVKTLRNFVLIGRSETNGIVKSLCGDGLVRLSSDYPGIDGFILRTVSAREHRRNYLVIGGSEDCGTLYGVYHLLESVFHVGFFEDGEYIPKYKGLRTAALKIAERPAFKIRAYMQLCSNAYSSRHWLLPEWKFECDYSAKKKQNLLCVDGWMWTDLYIKRKVEAQYGVLNPYDPNDPNPNEKASLCDVKLISRVNDHVRRNLGLKLLSSAMLADGAVSRDFAELILEIPYLNVPTLSADPLLYYIDPRRPEFVDYVAKYLAINNELFGTDHYYFGSPIGGELGSVTIGDAEVNKTVRSDYAKAIIAAIKKVDPKGIFFANGWGWMNNWTPEGVKQMCEATPKDSFLTSDMAADLSSVYKRFDYFSGRDWLIGVLHSFGGDEAMFGDMQGTVDMFKDVLTDPKAARCIGTSIMPEIIDHNPIYWDLLMQATWNPGKVNIDSSLKDIALRRYGRKSAQALYPAMKLLRESVYCPGSVNVRRPLYRAYGYICDIDKAMYKQRISKAPKLRQALEIMINEVGNQNGNGLYDNDLVNVCKQYAAVVMDDYVLKLEDAFKAGNREEFERCVGGIDRCFDSLALILSSNKRYFLETEIRQQMVKYEANGRKGPETGQACYLKNAAMLRQSANPGSNEYCSKDRYELVEHYYRPKMRIYLDVLREKMLRGDTTIRKEDLVDRCEKLRVQYWSDDSTNMKESDKYKGTVAEAAAEALANLKNVPTGLR